MTTQSTNARLRSVFFDLDGTLADTARDLHLALDRLCEEEGSSKAPYDAFRPIVSQGSPAMLRVGLGVSPEDPHYERLRARLLTLYSEEICTHTTLFAGTDRLIAQLQERGFSWGIVTNKPGWLTDKLLEEMQFGSSAACIISGDTLPRRKPHPDQLLLACQYAGCSPTDSVYVGDARSDIVAGRAAGMRTICALFGYIPPHEDPLSWQADADIDSPLALLDWLAEREAVGGADD